MPRARSASSMHLRALCLSGLCIVLLACASAPKRGALRASPALRRAEDYLVRELALWHAEERCASCHHDGDAARFLWSRREREDSPSPSPPTLEASCAWLADPAQWWRANADPRFSDAKLALVQFAAALRAAIHGGAPIERGAMQHAARELIAIQEEAGCWLSESADRLGGPVTYGPFLATHLAIETLEASAIQGAASAIAKARAWLAQSQPKATIELASVCWSLAAMAEPLAREARDRALERLLAAQARDGSFGAWSQSSAEIFDTAVALLALEAQAPAPRIEAATLAARGFLEREQTADGSWNETTRPAGGTSRAHRVSTSAWAASALRCLEAIDPR